MNWTFVFLEMLRAEGCAETAGPWMGSSVPTTTASRRFGEFFVDGTADQFPGLFLPAILVRRSYPLASDVRPTHFDDWCDVDEREQWKVTYGLTVYV